MPAASFKSFVEMFHHRIRSTPDSDAFYYKKDRQWSTLLWREVGVRVRNIACGLRALGIEDEQRVAILSGTRVEWILADLGILCSGAATTTIYPSSQASDCAYIIDDSATRMLVAEDDRQVEKIRMYQSQHPLELQTLTRIIVIHGTPSADGFVLTLAQLEAQGAEWDAAHPGDYDRIGAAVGSEQLATLIYTSGTTGRPKGVMLTHDSWVYEGEAVDNLGILSPADKQYLWLPLAHSFGKVLEAVTIRIGVPTAIDGVIEELVDNLAVIQPTWMGAVPRIFEKVYNRILATQMEKGGLSLRVFNHAVAVGRQVSRARQQGQEPGGLLSLKYSLADRLVFSKIRARFGGRIRFFISGSAPLSKEIAEFFHAAGILVLEGYGLTETSAASYVNRPEKFRFGTVGVPVDGTQVRIESDGEILLKGRGVMRGYYNLPEATAEALTPDGWLRTGDIGMIEDGFLKITDRKKDLIKTSGGKYVAPQALEARIKLASTLVSHALVHGDRRNFCTALLTLNPETVIPWARQQGLITEDPTEVMVKAGENDPAKLERQTAIVERLSKNEAVKAELRRALDTVNRDLNSFESIKNFAVLDQDFSEKDGDLTPSLKVKRKAIERKHAALLDSFYVGQTLAV